VVGDAGLLFDPLDVPAMTESLIRLLQDQPLRRQLIIAGIQRAKGFSWDSAAEATLAELEAAAAP
jgi:alpha-1,3-rhamnosyl/mannosyltransferase